MTPAAAYIAIVLIVLAPGCGEAAAAGADGAAARGRSDYATYCAPCHGSAGGGDGPLARMLVPRPARHSDAAFMDALTDAYLFRLLGEGGPALGKSPLMAAWGRILSEQQIRDLVAFLRSLPQPGERQDAREERRNSETRLRLRVD
jgi:cytochrome c oxidase cbb3-type subunit 3